MLSIIMTIINISSLILIAIAFFREHYTIIDLETWNTIATYYNEHTESEEDNCGGGQGFFFDYISDVEEPDEEEGE